MYRIVNPVRSHQAFRRSVQMAALEGHLSDPPVKQTLNKMKSLCLNMKILGSYPKVDDDAGLSTGAS